MYKDLNVFPAKPPATYMPHRAGATSFGSPPVETWSSNNGSLGRGGEKCEGHNRVAHRLPVQYSSPDGQYRWVQRFSWLPRTSLTGCPTPSQPEPPPPTNRCAFLTATSPLSRFEDQRMDQSVSPTIASRDHVACGVVLAGALKALPQATLYSWRFALRAVFRPTPPDYRRERSSTQRREKPKIRASCLGLQTKYRRHRPRSGTHRQVPDTILGLAPVTPINSAPTAVAASHPDDGMTRRTQNAVDLVARYRTCCATAEIGAVVPLDRGGGKQRADDKPSIDGGTRDVRSIVVVRRQCQGRHSPWNRSAPGF